MEPPAGPPAEIAAFHFELPAANREAALAMVFADTVVRRGMLAGPWAALLTIEAPMGGAFHAGLAAIGPPQAQPARALCHGPVAFDPGTENGAPAFRLESESPALWRSLGADAAMDWAACAPARIAGTQPEARFRPYTFNLSLRALPLRIPEAALGGADLRGHAIGEHRAAEPRAAALQMTAAPALRRARPARPPALRKCGVPAWSGAGARLAMDGKAQPAHPRRLGHPAAALKPATPAAPAALPPLRADLDAPRDTSMPAAAPHFWRPAIAPVTISIRPVEPAAKAATRQARATMPRMPLVAAGFAEARRRPCVPRFVRPAPAALAALAGTSMRRNCAALPEFTATLPAPLVGGPSSVPLEEAPRAAGGAREAAVLTFGCRGPATEARCVPALFSPAPERCALAPSSRYFEFTPEASMWNPEPAPKTGAFPLPSPGEETGSLRVSLPRKAGPVRDGARPQQAASEPWTFPCMAPRPVEAVIEGFELQVALKPFEKEFKDYATRRQRFVAMDAWRYARVAGAAALVLVAMGLGSLAGVRRAPDVIEQRATVEWNESFRSGLKLWRGASSWTVDGAGYARPAQLAVFIPSRELSNYRLHFLTLIESKGVAWAFRVQDPKNYQGAELSVAKPGPRPLLELTRYTVMGGRRQGEVRTPLNVMAHNNTPLQVTLEAAGDSFRIDVEGEKVDEWTDGRLPAGGIGFFSDSGSRARIYWVQLASHPDWLGRLCALFTTGNRPVTAQIQPAEGQDHGNDAEFRIRRVGTGKSRVQLHR